MCNMKKIVSLLLMVAMLMCGFSFAAAEGETTYRVAMITDSGDITDQSFNQTTYEACKAFCDANGVDFNYFKPTGDSDPERVAQIEAAVDEGYNVIVLPGYLFAPAIAECQPMYPDVKFIALDVSEADLTGNNVDITSAPNLFSAVYQEELSGYMAGYAAVKMGYEHLGFLGGMAVPAVIRFGYGFVQGADAAAVELGKADKVTVEYVYGNQFYGDPDITAYMDNWYQTMGVQAVFACGGGIYTSAAEAARNVDGGKVIGVDTDQSAIIDTYGEKMTLTSAMKGLAATVNTLLTETVAGNFANYGGKIENLGLVSATELDKNYVGLPMESTQWKDTFTQDDYAKLVASMVDGTITVSNATDAMPAVSIKVNEYGNIK
jgi:basic membrane protein A